MTTLSMQVASHLQSSVTFIVAFAGAIAIHLTLQGLVVWHGRFVVPVTRQQHGVAPVRHCNECNPLCCH